MKKRIIALGALVLIVILGWSAGWLYFAGEVRKGIEVMASADGVTSPRIACEKLGVGGYPFRFDVDCTNGTATLGDVTATLAELRVSVLVYRLSQYRISAKGPAAISDAFTGSASVLAWKTLEASARFDGTRIGRISVETTEPVWTDAVFGDALIASADKLETHFLDIPDRHEPQKGLAALATYSVVDGLKMPGFALNAAHIELETEISGLPDDAQLLTLPDALPRWQQSGGKVQVVSLKGNDGETFADGSGTLGLDDQARIEGQFTLISRGLTDLLFVAVPPALKGAVIGPVAEDGSSKQVFNLRAGVMVVGLVPLVMLSPLF